MDSFKFLVNDKDITNYIISFSWSGDNSQAGRKLEFTVAFNNVTKDSTFTNPYIIAGDKITVKYILNSDSMTPGEFILFKGQVWLTSRNTSGYDKSFTAYDNIIFLAKSKLNKKFQNATVYDVLKQVANEFGMNILLDEGITLDAKGDFIADNMSGTEIFKKALDIQSAKDGKAYCIMALDENNNIVIGYNDGKEVENFSLTDTTNVFSSSHSESLENLVSMVYIADNNGNTSASNVVQSDYGLQHYGKVTQIYKPDKKVDTATASRALLHSVDYESSLEAIGNIFCVAGKSVTIQEENLKGKFFIKSDSHSFNDGQHTMRLSLDFTSLH